MSEANEAQRTLLLVEDERIVSLSTTHALEAAGYAVAVAAGGEEAVALVTWDTRIDLVLMDIDLGPGMDGVSAAKAILEIRALPIVFLTSHTEQAMVARVAPVTRYGYVDKQSGTFVLLEAVSRAIQLFETERELRLHKERFQAIAEQADDGLAVFEANTLTYTTERYAGLMGYESPEQLTRDRSGILERIHPGDRERVVALYREARDSHQETIRYRYRAKRWDGSYIGVEDVARLSYEPRREEFRAIITSRRSSDIEELSYRSLFDAAPNPISIYDREARFVDLNKSALDSLGMTRDEIYMRPLSDIVPGMHEITKQRVARCIDHDDCPKYVDRLESADGTVRWFSSTFQRVELRGHDEPVAQVISFDITKKREHETARADQQRLTDALMRAAPLMIYVYDVAANRNVWVNDSYRRFLEEIDPDSGTHLSRTGILQLIHPDDRHVITDRARRRLQDRARPEEALEFRLGHEGHWRWMVNRSAPYEYSEDGSVQKIIGFLYDITDQKQVQHELEEASAELEELVEKNELLMQEMNHRVKNNLLMVRSLIHLAEEERGVDLSDIAHQVTSISLVHELLHESETTETINIRSYVGRILESIFPPLGSHQVVVENNVVSAAFPPKTAGVLGLIVNEAATNAAKHAFAGSQIEHFCVTLERPRRKEWQLSIENTGRPFPEDVSLANPTSLGLRLMTMLASQLDGTVELLRSPRTRFVVRFPV